MAYWLQLSWCMRYRFAEHEEFPLHITAKSSGPSWSTLGYAHVWKAFCGAIADLQEEYEIKSHAFVMMSNHYHWLCSYDAENDPHFFEWFHELASIKHLHITQRNGLYYQDKAKVNKIKNFEFYRNTYKYVYANPVEAGIVDKAEDYPFSTLHFLFEKQVPPMEWTDNMNLFVDPFRTLDWINGKLSHDKYSQIFNN